jgi:phosphonoacetaldehyde hydrolase
MYDGKSANAVRAVIFDWAGTMIDFGSRAPVSAFIEIFRQSGVEITEAEAREPMGRGKFDHIATITRMPRVAEAWRERHGRPPGEHDVRTMYDAFLPIQKEVLSRHTELVPGVLESIAFLNDCGAAIGSTTGYTRALMDVVEPAGRQQGLEVDHVVCIDDVPEGRPAPWMLLRSAERLNAFPIVGVVAVDDTCVGIEAAKHAGAVAVGVALSGNALGLSLEQFRALSSEDLASRSDAAYAALQKSRPDFVIDSVADLPRILPDIEGLIAERFSSR